MSMWMKRTRRAVPGLAAALMLTAVGVASQQVRLEPHQELARDLLR